MFEVAVKQQNTNYPKVNSVGTSIMHALVINLYK